MAPRPMTRAPDVLVIGAGIVGLSIAWHLVRTGAQVLVADPYPAMGCGASGAASGILLPPMGRRASTPWGQVQHAAWRQWDAWRQALESAAGLSVGWTPCGVLRMLAQEPRQVATDQTWHADVRDLEPALAAAPPPHGALRTDCGGHVQSHAVLSALSSAIRAAGGQIRTLSISHMRRPSGARRCIMAYSDDHESIIADRIVVAAGFDTSRLVAGVGVRLPLSRDAGAILHLRATPRPTRIVCRDHVTVAAKPDATVVVTGAHWGDVPPHLTLDRLADLWRGAVQILGCEGTVHQTWSGVRVRGPHGRPVIGRIPMTNLFVAAGVGSQGYLLAPILGPLLHATEVERADQAFVAPDPETIAQRVLRGVR